MAHSGAPDEVSTEQKVSFLQRPDAYGPSVSRVDVIETHMSWVFLTERRVYKLKKPLRSAFMDLRSVASRRQNCRRSIRLNRRLAGDVYIGALPLTRKPQRKLELGGEGEVVDWLVKMRRLPAHRMLDAAIETRSVTREDIRKVSERLLAFYAARKPISIPPARYLESFSQDIRNTDAVLSDPRHGLPLQLVRRLTGVQHQFVERCAEVLARRARDRHIVEAHGDLRPEHVCLIAPPVIIDCLEFNRSLRLLDPADELAYLALECERLGEPGLGKQLLQDYQQRSAQTLPENLFSFYALFRACLRAKIAVWHLDDPSVSDRHKWIQRAREYLHIAQRKASTALPGA